jgi:hypothetical protein
VPALSGSDVDDGGGGGGGGAAATAVPGPLEVAVVRPGVEALTTAAFAAEGPGAAAPQTTPFQSLSARRRRCVSGRRDRF